MRVVIDTNVFVSGSMLPDSIPGRILAAAIVGGFEIVLCEAIVEEISAALRYPKVRKRIALSDDELDRYVQALRFMADMVDPASVVVEVPGDRNDDVILATLVVAKADPAHNRRCSAPRARRPVSDHHTVRILCAASRLNLVLRQVGTYRWFCSTPKFPAQLPTPCLHAAKLLIGLVPDQGSNLGSAD